MRPRVRWRVAALTFLVITALVSVPSSRAQHGRVPKSPSGLTASSAAASAPPAQFAEAFVGPWANAGQIRYQAMAFDGQGNIIVTGSFFGQIDFGGGEVLSKGGLDIFIAKYAPDGTYLWSKGIGGTRDDWAKAVAVDPAGNIVITSWSGSGTVDFGGGPINLAAGYLAKYDPNGAYLWARALGTNVADGTALDTDSYGNVIVGGYFTGPCDFGGGSINSVQSGDAFLAKYAPTGGYLWAIRAGGSAANGTQVSQITVDHSDEIVMTGWTTGAGSMGGVSFPGFGSNDIFLAKYTATGAPRWSKSLGGAGQDRGKGVAIDSLNNIVMTGLLGDNATLGSGTLVGGGIFLSKYSPTGVTLWSENFPPPGGATTSLENGNAVAVDGGDNIAITGAVVGDANLGGGLLPMGSGDYNNNTYIAEYTSAGSNIWSARFPNLIPPAYPGFNSGKAIGTDALGSVIVFGVFSDSINFGLGVLTNPGTCGGSCGYGAYLAKFGSTSPPPTPTPTAPAATATPTQTPTVAPTATPTPTASNGLDVVASGDFDGDGLADKAVFRPGTGTWYVVKSDGSGSLSVQWGASGDIPVAGNYAGDARADFAVFRPSSGTWYVLSAEGVSQPAVQWGASGDVPVPGQYGGDSRIDFAVWRPGNGTWYVRTAEGVVLPSVQWGAAGDIPVPGDYDGDGVTDMAVFRPSNGTWYVRFSRGGTAAISWGASGDIPVAADFTGDGRADYGIFRPSTGAWYVKSSATLSALPPVVWGAPGDVPLPSQMAGDSRADNVVWRASNGNWYVRSAEGLFPPSVVWGTSGDIPLAH